MLQGGGESDLLEKPFCAEQGSELGVKNLYGNFAIVFLVMREVDSSHSTATEFAFDSVSREGALNLLKALCHRESAQLARIGSMSQVWLPLRLIGCSFLSTCRE